MPDTTPFPVCVPFGVLHSVVEKWLSHLAHNQENGRSNRPYATGFFNLRLVICYQCLRYDFHNCHSGSFLLFILAITYTHNQNHIEMKNFLIGRVSELGSYPPPVVDLTDGIVTIRDYASFLLKVNATPADSIIEFKIGGKVFAVSNDGSLEGCFKQGEVVDIEVSYSGYNTETMQVVMDEPKTIDISLSKIGVYKPEEAPNGVYIYCSDGLMYKPEAYDNEYRISYGVGIKTDEHSFIVTVMSGRNGAMAWGANNIDVSTYGAFSSNTVTAFTYKNGRAASDAIYNAKLGTPAVNYCEKTVYRSNNGYLASLYEMQMIDKNMDAIRSCIDKMNSLRDDTMNYISGEYWSSIQATESTAWCCKFEVGKRASMRHTDKTETHLAMVLTEFA